MSHPILLDEMFSGAIAEELRAKGHDAQAVVTDPTLISLPDDQVLARAAAAGRALVTANIKDFMPLDAQYRAAGQTHAGLQAPPPVTPDQPPPPNPGMVPLTVPQVTHLLAARPTRHPPGHADHWLD